MDRSNLSALWKQIDQIYPGFSRKLIEQGAQDIWISKLGGMSYGKAIAVLDKHLAGEKGDRPPSLSTFYRESGPRTDDVFMDTTPHQYHVSPAGELLDEEDREYGGSYSNGEPYRYYYNSLGYICRLDEEGKEIVITR